jgi:hypothetical protein
MAKMSSYEIGKLKSNIIDGLYRKREDELMIRRAAIAKKNRELQLAPIQYLLDQLPTDMIAHADEYVVRIKYTGEIAVVDEKWDYKTDDPIINPQKVSSSHYQNTPDNDLKEELKEEADKLCEDIVFLKTEKEEMSLYLKETTSKYTGSLQLRKVWKNHPMLLKYLPSEPVKVSRPKPEKKVSVPDREVPIFLKNRMTTNLLEDN